MQTHMEEEQTILVRCRTEKMKMKDISLEVRAKMDISCLLGDAYVSLNENEANIDTILQNCLFAMDIKEKLTEFVVREAAEVVWCDKKTAIFSDKIQNVSKTRNGPTWDNSWACILLPLPSLQYRKLAFIRFAVPTNLGAQLEHVRFLLFVFVPLAEKVHKNAAETGRTFSSLLSLSSVRQRLLEAQSVADFRAVFIDEALNITNTQAPLRKGKRQVQLVGEDLVLKSYFHLGVGLKENVTRRLGYYWSDFKDGFADHLSIHKTVAATFYLYFTTILPCIAFGVVNSTNTHGAIDARMAITGQAIGGLAFALTCGQPLVMIATTAPATLFTKVIYEISQDFNVDFFALFAVVGLFNALFCTLMSVFNVCQMFKWCTRSTEEIFASFSVFVSFIVYAVNDTIKSFRTNYYCSIETVANDTSRSKHTPLDLLNPYSVGNSTTDLNPNLHKADMPLDTECGYKENSLLFVLLMLGTFWFARTVYNFKYTPYLSRTKREVLSDYALPLSVIIFTVIGSLLFKDINVARFPISSDFQIKLAKLDTLTPGAIGIGAVLGLLLAILFYMDQNITAAYVNRPDNKLKKGSAYHLDLLSTGLISGVTSLFGFPLMHGILPHSYLQVLALADIEDKIDDGHVHQEIVKVRETRLPVILSHIMIGLSLLAIPYPLTYIPVPVLDGLFLFCAIGMLHGHNLFERLLLFFTEQNWSVGVIHKVCNACYKMYKLENSESVSYPPTHYIRRCPQKQIHLFTVCQLVCVGLLCLFGFFPWVYMEMVFPIIVAAFIPIRHKIFPLIIQDQYLDVLDGLYA